MTEIQRFRMTEIQRLLIMAMQAANEGDEALYEAITRRIDELKKKGYK